MTEGLGIEGLQKAQYDNQQRIARLRPDSDFGRAIKDITVRLQRYAISITHVWVYKGGGLRASHRMAASGLQGRIFIDPGAVNPRGQRPAVYGPYEERRGGSHAFYLRTVDEGGEGEVSRVIQALGRRLI